MSSRRAPTRRPATGDGRQKTAEGGSIAARPALVLALVLVLLVPARCSSEAIPPQVRELAGLLRAQRSPQPAFAESFTGDLRRWGLETPLGPEGMVLDREGGTVPGASRLFVPGLLLRDGVVSCRLRLAPEDTGTLMFRANDDADAAYQILLTTRADGSVATGFAKKHNLEQLYGGACVGQVYRASVAPGHWLRLDLYFQGGVLLALVDGEPAAYYDRADTRDGSISFYCGEHALALRDLAVYTFSDQAPISPYGLVRRPARGAGKLGDEPPLFSGPEGPPLAPRRGVETPEAGAAGTADARRWAPGTSRPARPAGVEGSALSFIGGGVSPAGPPRVSGDIVGGSFAGTGGVVHAWRLERDGRFLVDGEELIPLRDTDGLYWAQVPGDVVLRRAVRSMRDGPLLDRVRSSGMPWAPVRVRLVDTINATATDHEFGEDPVLDGASRVLEIAGRRYRVTSSRRWLSYFAYTARTDSPLKPHLLLADAPNDRERYLNLRIQPPDGSGGDPEYGIGAGTYTGRGLPCDNKPFSQALLFVPRSPLVRFTVSRMPGEERGDRNNGAAVAQIFLFAFVDLPARRPNPVLPALDAEERTLALAVPSARAILRQSGAGLESPAATRAQRADGYRSFLHHLRFLGFNALDLGILDTQGSDVRTDYVAGRVLEGGSERGIFTDLLPLAGDAGIRVTPVVPPLPLTSRLLLRGGSSAEWAVSDRDGQTGCAGIWPMLDLLHPDAAALALEFLRDVAGRFVAAGCRDVALAVEGDAGGCIPRAGLMRADEVGYGAADVSRFSCETGIAVPGNTPSARYVWLRDNAWGRWTEWRCRLLQSHWLRARDLVRGLRADARLVLKLALPDRELAKADAWFEEKRPPLDLLRAHGYEPRLYTDAEGIILGRTMDIAYDRVRTCAHRENAAALDSFDYQGGLAELYKSKEPEAVEISFAPWEESGQHLGSEFFPRGAGHWGASTMVPWGRWLFRPLTSALRNGNPCRISLSGTEFATAGREHDWRRFARAYRALPAVQPEGFEGTASLLAPGAKPGTGTPLPGEVVVRRYGSRIGVLNDSGQGRRVELLPRRMPLPGERWVDLATGFTLAHGGREAAGLILDLDAFDLRTLAILPDIPDASERKLDAGRPVGH